jgi:hypothetical protein
MLRLCLWCFVLWVFVVFCVCVCGGVLFVVYGRRLLYWM